jgi:nicotinamide-nucleotide amidase
VFTIGGLGPTDDDLTRDAIAAALEDELIHNPATEAHLREIFKRRGLQCTDAQLKQAKQPTCASLIENPNGTAPGLICQKDGKTLVALPGPRGEFNPMVEGPVRMLLASFGGDEIIVSRTIKICGMGESMVERRIRALMSGSNPSIGTYAHPGQVDLRLTAKAPSSEAARELIAPVEAAILDALGGHVFGFNNDTLEGVILNELRTRGETLVTAESCTGGGVGQRLTRTPGASDVYMGGVVTYTNGLKETLLGVSLDTLSLHGAVSEETAREMAAGARTRLGGTWSIAVTGIAGPGGGSEDKPVGLVYLATEGPLGVRITRNEFPGSRELVRERSIQWVLTQLRSHILSN